MGDTADEDRLPPLHGEGQPGEAGQGGEPRSPTAQARAARQALTPPEARLWKFLKTLRSSTVHFRRQYWFRGRRLDFVCFKKRLVIEADGLAHNDPAQAERDRIRDVVLRREGFRVLRFASKDVALNFDWVIDTIRHALADRTPPWPLTRPVPPHEGEGDQDDHPPAKREGLGACDIRNTP